MPDGKDTKYLPTSWYDPRLEIRPSSIQGGGMFARAPFQPGETVAIVGGTLMTGAEFAAYLTGAERWNAHQIGEDLHLVDLIQTPDVVDGSLNHSCDSNLWMGDEVTIIARRAISAGGKTIPAKEAAGRISRSTLKPLLPDVTLPTKRLFRMHH